jgi:rare lipoprotein A
MKASKSGPHIACLLGIAALLTLSNGHASAQEIEIPVPQSVDLAPPVAAQIGQGRASWYGPRFHGRRTSNGERFDMNELTAAHKSLPFGTRVLVRNISNGREVVVRINDRAPGIKGRIIDLSKAAAAALGFLQSGEAHVELMEH